jgi:hypothetical protein
MRSEIEFIEYLERQIISSGERVYTAWLISELRYRKDEIKQELNEGKIK